ncbi:MAG: transglycosylase domain-containing protein, partial [Bacillota bacterium]|nr:transglycosylase domain-containing protein [Bacillota bacterium]
MNVKNNTPAKKKKRKKKKNIFFRIFKATSLIIISIIILSAVAAGGVALAIIRTTPALDVNSVLSLNEPSSIFDSSGNYIDDVSTDEKRTVIELKDMPVHLQDAFISIEDERFRSHNGIDPKRIAGSILFDIKSKLTGKKLLQGGSTLTQQLVSNTILTKKVTFQRKIQEMYLATQLEKQLSKDDILQAYMNTIFLGGYSNGVETAANQYFNKSAKDLTLIECAFIAGLAQNPSGSYSNVITDLKYPNAAAKASEDAKIADDAAKKAADTTNKSASEVKSEKAAAKKAADTAKLSAAAVKAHNSYISRTKTVIYKMYTNNHITKAEYDSSIDSINAGNLKFNIQYASTKNRLNYEWFSLPAIEQIRENLKKQYNYNDKEINSLLMYGGLKIYITMDKNLQDAAQKIINNNDNYNGNNSIKNGIPELQSSVVITDYHTGEVKVIIGGRGEQPARSYNRAAFNGAKQFLRPTGSSIKPLAVYAPAIDTKQ